MPDSISVKVGDKVKQGELIAKCGSSGNAYLPHVHFQLQSKKSFFTSAGLPVSFSNINVQQSSSFDRWPYEGRRDGNLQQTADGRIYIGFGLDIENVNKFS